MIDNILYFYISKYSDNDRRIQCLSQAKGGVRTWITEITTKLYRNKMKN